MRCSNWVRNVPIYTARTPGNCQWTSKTRPAAISSHRTYSSESNPAPSLSPKWLSEVQNRIGKCITFGMSGEQTNEAIAILKTIAKDWRDLLAGSEGFLTAKDRRGLYRHTVTWGDMDSMVSPSRPLFVTRVNRGDIICSDKIARVMPSSFVHSLLYALTISTRARE